MSECVCCGVDIIGDGTERGDGFFCEECRDNLRYGFGECCNPGGDES